MFLYLIIRIPKSLLLSPLLNSSQNNFLNIGGIIYFSLISLFELFLVLQVVLNWTNEEYEIREGSVIHRKGIFRLREEIFTLRNLASSRISQNFFGKLFNFGTITLSSPLLKQDVYLINIHDPKKIITSLEDNLEDKNLQGGTILRRKN
jgi:uncharacterized membrane protein YdbT with pleckstrin-like domain